MLFEPTQINIQTMEINNTDHSSSLSFGSSFKVNRNVSAKKNQGIGQQHADFSVQFSTISVVIDNDLSDAFTRKITIL